jgi:serine/threonine-protein kinase
VITEGHFDYAAAEREYALAFRQAGLAPLRLDVLTAVGRVRASAVREQLVAALDDWAHLTRDRRRRAWLLAVARRADPDPWRDRLRNPAVWQDRAALKRLARRARVMGLSPRWLPVLRNILMEHQGDAMRLLTAAQQQSPQDFWVNFTLANALYNAKQPAEAIAYYRAALALRPNASVVHYNLGNALKETGRHDEALACLRKANYLDPKLAQALAQAHYHLGNAWSAKGRWGKAIASYRRAVAFNPRYSAAHYHLGHALKEKGRLGDAITAYQRAIARNPKSVLAHSALCQALLKLGQFPQAQTSLRRWLALLPSRHPKRPRALQLLGECKRLLALDAKLTVLLRGKGQPAGAAESLQMAFLCHQYKQLYGAAARFYAAAFAAQPLLADDLQAANRFNAACAAALAGCGRGGDAVQLKDEEKTRLRGQALAWLRAELALCAKQLEGNTAQARAVVRQHLEHWKRTPSLAGLRNAPALAKLPAADCKEWTKLWADVAALLKKAHQSK